MHDVPARIQPITRRRTFWSSRAGRGVRAAVVFTIWLVGFAIIGNGAVHLYVALTDSRMPSVSPARSRAVVPTVGRSSFAVQPTTPTAGRVNAFVIPTHSTESTPTTEAPLVDPTLPSTAAPATATTAPIQMEPSPTAEPTKVKAPPVRLRIEGIGVDAPVVLVRGETLPRQPIAGWYFGTAYPGEAGNVVLLGHLNGAGELFGDLDQLRPGDSIHVDTADGTIIYAVEGVQLVDRRAIELLGSTSEPTLTLMTCAGDWRDEINGYDMRLVVQARLAS